MLPVATVATWVAGAKTLASICAVLVWCTLAESDDAKANKTLQNVNYCRYLHGTCLANCSHGMTLEGTVPGLLCDEQLLCCVLEQNIQGPFTGYLNAYEGKTPNDQQATKTTDQGPSPSINGGLPSSSAPATMGVTTSQSSHRHAVDTYKYRGMIIPSFQKYLQKLSLITIPTTSMKPTNKVIKSKFIQIKDFDALKGSISEDLTTPTSLQDPTERDYKCGVSPSVREKRIVGGTRAKRCAFPWMVYIERDPHKDDLCGGTLVSHRHVITAAHCFDFLGANWPKLILGEYTHGENITDDSLVTSDYRILTHPAYDRMTYHYDIAVLILSTPVHFKDCLHPICLPQTGQMMAPGSSCSVAGWGSTSRTADFPAVSSPFLMQADVTVVEGRYCHDKYQNMFDPRIHMCAGDLSGGADSCVGDSGGPLMCRLSDSTNSKETSREDTPLFLMGVISAGANPCAQRDTPAVYTDVSKTRDWLHSVMGF